MLLLLQLKYILVYLFVVVGHIYFSWNCTNPIYLNPKLYNPNCSYRCYSCSKVVQEEQEAIHLTSWRLEVEQL